MLTSYSYKLWACETHRGSATGVEETFRYSGLDSISGLLDRRYVREALTSVFLPPA